MRMVYTMFLKCVQILTREQKPVLRTERLMTPFREFTSHFFYFISRIFARVPWLTQPPLPVSFLQSPFWLFLQSPIPWLHPSLIPISALVTSPVSIPNPQSRDFRRPFSQIFILFLLWILFPTSFPVTSGQLLSMCFHGQFVRSVICCLWAYVSIEV